MSIVAGALFELRIACHVVGVRAGQPFGNLLAQLVEQVGPELRQGSVRGAEVHRPRREKRGAVFGAVAFPHLFAAIEFLASGRELIMLGDSEEAARTADGSRDAGRVLQPHGNYCRVSVDFCGASEKFRQYCKSDAAVGRGFEHRIRPVACDGDPHVGEIQRPFFARRRRDRPGHLRVFSGLEEQVARVQAIAVLAAGNDQQKHTYIY